MEGGQKELWISDFGATEHICGNKSWFETYKAYDEPRPVQLTDKSQALVCGSGKVKMEAF